VRGNVLVRTWTGVWLNWGSNNVIENNIVLDSRYAHLMLNNWRRSKKWKTEGNVCRRNILCGSDGTPVYALHGWKGPTGPAACSENLLWPGAEEPNIAHARPPEGMSAWNWWRQAGQDTGSVVADPMFVDAPAGDYRLQPGSPALALGFEQIPLDRIGPEGWPRTRAARP